MKSERFEAPLSERGKLIMKLINRPVKWIGEKYFQVEVEGMEKIPEGAALLTGQHNGGLMVADSVIFFREYAERYDLEELPLSLAHWLVMKVPLLGRILEDLDVVPASPENAIRALKKGRKVLVYPGGDWETMRPSRERDRVDFGGRTGFIKTALRAGAPIVPIVAAGAHDGWYVITRGEELARRMKIDKWLRIKVFPIALAMPMGLLVGPIAFYIPLPHKIIMKVMDPIEVEGDPEDQENLERIYEEIMERMQAELDELTVRLPRRQNEGGLKSLLKSLSLL